MELQSLPAAATTILVRQGRAGLQVYLVRRSPGSGFMAGNYVFPGGVVDPADRDADAWVGFGDLTPEELGERLGGDLSWEQALAYAVAAIRETAEEAGVLLGVTGEPERRQGILERRSADGLPPGWLFEAASSRVCRLSLSSLAPWARWVTPAGMKRRYDTRFFLALLPSGQACSPDGREVVEGLWSAPEEALARNGKGEVPLSPPTLVTLHQLLGCGDAGELIAEAGRRGWGEANLPRFVPFDGGAVILEPWDPEIGKEKLSFDSRALEQALLPVGEPFSRLWSDGRLWRPVRVV